MKKILIIIVVLVIAGFIFSVSRESKPIVDIPTIPETQTQPTALCYYRSDKTASGLYDRAWIRLMLQGTAVTGEFNNYPAEKDSKVGSFTGTVSALDQMSMSRTASVVWNTKAEGMEAKEELLILFGDGSAQAAFGEMVQGANGVYVYKDKTAVTYQGNLSQIDCGALDEILAVETYVRATDLQALTKASPVLGGRLFVASVVVNPSAHTALITYEDGHIAGKGALVYSYDQTTKKVTVNSFTKAQ
jgi:hypothetical protein